MKKFDIFVFFVKDKWGIRLWVIEVYDLDRRVRYYYGIYFLYYEGCVVDIVIEDKDKDKYFFLGRLVI